MKTCSKCNQNLSLSDFYKNVSRKDGVSIYCKKCMNIINKGGYYNKWHERRKNIDKNHYQRIHKLREEIDEYKILIGCKNCGYNEHACVLDFHHLNEDDKFMTVAKMINNKRKNVLIQQEINKCTILCANCHRLVHNKLLNSNFELCQFEFRKGGE